MSDDLVKRAINELRDVVRCRCHRVYKDRGRHDPACECDSADAVKAVADRIEALEAELTDVRRAADWLVDGFQRWADSDHEFSVDYALMLSTRVETYRAVRRRDK